MRNSIRSVIYQELFDTIGDDRLRRELSKRPYLVNLVNITVKETKLSTIDWVDALEEFASLHENTSQRIDLLLQEIYSRIISRDDTTIHSPFPYTTSYINSSYAWETLVSSTKIFDLLRHVECTTFDGEGLYYIFGKLRYLPLGTSTVEILKMLVALPITYAIEVVCNRLELLREYSDYAKKDFDLLSSLTEMSNSSRYDVRCATGASTILMVAYSHLDRYYKYITETPALWIGLRSVLLSYHRRKTLNNFIPKETISRLMVAAMNRYCHPVDTPCGITVTTEESYYEEILELCPTHPLDMITCYSSLYDGSARVITHLLGDNRFSSSEHVQHISKALYVSAAKGVYDIFSEVYDKSHNITNWQSLLDCSIAGKNLNIMLMVISDERVIIRNDYYGIIARRFTVDDTMTIFDALSTRTTHTSKTLEELYELNDPTTITMLIAYIGRS